MRCSRDWLQEAPRAVGDVRTKRPSRRRCAATLSRARAALHHRERRDARAFISALLQRTQRRWTTTAAHWLRWKHHPGTSFACEMSLRPHAGIRGEGVPLLRVVVVVPQRVHLCIGRHGSSTCTHTHAGTHANTNIRARAPIRTHVVLLLYSFGGLKTRRC